MSQGKASTRSCASSGTSATAQTTTPIPITSSLGRCVSPVCCTQHLTMRCRQDTHIKLFKKSSIMQALSAPFLQAPASCQRRYSIARHGCWCMGVWVSASIRMRLSLRSMAFWVWVDRSDLMGKAISRPSPAGEVPGVARACDTQYMSCAHSTSYHVSAMCRMLT